MKRSAPPLALSLVILLGLLGPIGCGSFKRFLYEGFGRDEWQAPERVVTTLALSPGDEIADLGSGGGYFTYRFAEAVGKSGKVYALDVDESLLAYIEGQAQERNLPQIVTVHAPEDGLGLPDASVDMIFLSNVYHHLPDPIDYFRGAGSALRKGGRLVVVEFRGASFPRGHATTPGEIRTQLQAAGYEIIDSYDFLEKQSFQIFRLGDMADGATNTGDH
ncbi:MAG TPA: methyltransferase domain-containing protein [Myxococcales bacterium]|nr:methyltransferase domain-containing protein [Myxococcales bacterium]